MKPYLGQFLLPAVFRRAALAVGLGVLAVLVLWLFQSWRQHGWILLLDGAMGGCGL